MKNILLIVLGLFYSGSLLAQIISSEHVYTKVKKYEKYVSMNNFVDNGDSVSFDFAVKAPEKDMDLEGNLLGSYDYKVLVNKQLSRICVRAAYVDAKAYYKNCNTTPGKTIEERQPDGEIIRRYEPGETTCETGPRLNPVARTITGKVKVELKNMVSTGDDLNDYNCKSIKKYSDKAIYNALLAQPRITRPAASTMESDITNSIKSVGGLYCSKTVVTPKDFATHVEASTTYRCNLKEDNQANDIFTSLSTEGRYNSGLNMYSVSKKVGNLYCELIRGASSEFTCSMN